MLKVVDIEPSIFGKEILFLIMLKLLASSATTLISLFTFFNDPVNARQITFGSGNDTITFSTLSYTTYGGSYEHFWITKNGKPCEFNWRWEIKICGRRISNDTLDKQWDINSLRLLPNATKAERQFFRYLQTTPWKTYAQGSGFGWTSFQNEIRKLSYRKFHFVQAPGSRRKHRVRATKCNLQENYWYINLSRF